MPAILLILAGLMGACGVALAAASAHGTAGAGLEAASSMLLFHACATVGAALALRSDLLWRPLGIAAAIGFVLGATLFAGDLSMRAFAAQRLFPMAAPIGGTILIASWLALSLAAAVRLVRR